MNGYDAWLERPYIERAAENDSYLAWCEKHDLNPDDDLWDEWQTDRDAAAEDDAIARAEADAEAAL